MSRNFETQGCKWYGVERIKSNFADKGNSGTRFGKPFITSNCSPFINTVKPISNSVFLSKNSAASNKFVTERHQAAVRCLPTTGVSSRNSKFSGKFGVFWLPEKFASAPAIFYTFYNQLCRFYKDFELLYVIVSASKLVARCCSARSRNFRQMRIVMVQPNLKIKLSNDLHHLPKQFMFRPVPGNNC